MRAIFRVLYPLVLLALPLLALPLLSLPLLSYADDTALSRIAFGSCADQNQPQPIWHAVAGAKPQFFIFLGDNIYHWSESYQERLTEYRKLGAKPGFVELRKLASILAIWDDNDYGAHDGGADYVGKDISKRAFLDFFEVPADDPRRERPGIYTEQIFGPPGRRVQIILLDTRWFRGKLRERKLPLPINRGPYLPELDPRVTLLGETQWAWLTEQLKKPAELRIIASSIQVLSSEHGWESWGNLPSERHRLFRLIQENHVNGVVIISGDRHSAEISRIDEGFRYPLFDITSSSLNLRRSFLKEPNRLRVSRQFFEENFGLISIDWDAPSPALKLEVRDRSGVTAVAEHIDLATLNPLMLPMPQPVQ